MKTGTIKSIILLCLLCCAGRGYAQHVTFLQQGRIEYEKRKNMHALLDESFGDDNQSIKELVKKETPNFKVTYFDLLFDQQTTLFKPGRDNPDNSRQLMEDGPGEANIIYSLLEKQESISQKKVFEQTYLVTDSIRRIKWKITDETRKIAGFDCRRANAVIMDSIYVVAFYTDAIITPGGPESFTGLPGMILGLAMPHEHITWFATKVLMDDRNNNAWQPPAKGKKVNKKELEAAMEKAVKGWGSYGKPYIKAVLL
ncbi:GLPGLI family protein [Chitinophaga nivalis]|uniref:GLPGLI family protein n=1 Tax=Chitinophaga nivalis TaxID=2991709 RepID=A0ABT3IPK4_9BACT|nr:GLPGLI family protein [Chitinophaga nivalis]MCW3464402.1 GLPGLI family protein [Chitinophaga nivalis]MCW3485907.1 GLPGLI family protein [Chitinophaga nivalis]